jgi:TRAP-type C4-dicarboxylate transport system permease small subunit
MKHKGIFDLILDSLAFLAGVLLVCTVIIVCFEICMRYFVGKPQIWTVEVCEYILFSLAFLGAPWLLKKGGHVSIDILLAQIKGRSRNYLELSSKAGGVLVSAIICWFSAVTAWDCYVSGVVVTKTLTIPKFYFLSLISLGYFVLLLEFARQFIKNLKRLREAH